MFRKAPSGLRCQCLVPGLRYRRICSRGGGQAEFLPGVQHGADAADAPALDIDAGVDAQPGHALVHAAALDAHLLGVDGEAAGPDRLLERLAGGNAEAAALDLFAHGKARRKLRQIGRERDVVGVARVGELVVARQPEQTPVERGGDEVGEHGRGRRALRQAVAVGDDLGAHGRCGRAQLERRPQQQPAHAAEIDGREEVFQIDVEHPALADVVGGIAGDAAPVDEAVRIRMRAVELLQFGVQAVLQIAHEADRSMDLAHAARALRDLEMPVAHVVGRAIERPDQPAERHVEIFGYIVRRLQRPPRQAENATGAGGTIANGHPTPRTLRTGLAPGEREHLLFCRRIDSRRRRARCRGAWDSDTGAVSIGGRDVSTCRGRDNAGRVLHRLQTQLTTTILYRD